MKKFFDSILFILVSTVFLCGILSCEVGMGPSVDQEAPKIEIKEPEGMIPFVAKTFDLKGTASDNVGVTKVEVTYKYKKDGEVVSKTDTASLSGESWSYSASFEEDCDVEFTVRAYDKMGNGDKESVDSKTVIIDSANPNTYKMAIKRGDYISKLLPLSSFVGETGKTALKDNPENKDYFQNQQFILYTTLKEAFGIKYSKLFLYEINEDGTRKGTTPVCTIDHITEDVSARFSPEFPVTADKLPASGLHYYQPVIEVSDDAGNVVQAEYDILAWYPEYDVPHVSYSMMEGDPDGKGKITVPQDSSIPVTVFDDDGIKTIKAKLVKTSDFTGIENITWVAEDSVSVEDGLRDKTFTVSTDKNKFADGDWKMIVMVEDVSTPPAVYTKAVNVKITNGDAATIIIDSPLENSVPALTNDKFTITGHTVDNQAVSLMAVAWLPNGNNDLDKAEAFFETYDFAADENKDGINYIKLTAGATTGSGSNTQNGFSKTFDYFEDFKKNGSVTNENKVFMFAVKDTTDNITIKTFRMNRFTSKPYFKVEYKETAAGAWTEDSNPLIMFEPKKVWFRITPLADNNMPITGCTISCSESGFSKTDWNATDGYALFDLSNGAGGAPGSGKNFNIQLSATDKLGNVTESKLTVGFDEQGTLQDITANCNKDKVFTEGEVFKLQANFSSRVSFITFSGSKKPYIQLSGTDFKKKNGDAVPEADRRAYYITGSESNTLYFEYTIPADVVCTNIRIPASNPISLNDATIDGIINAGGPYSVNAADSNICIDSIKPYILNTTPAVNGVVTKAGGKAEISFKFNEPVYIESGSLLLSRTADWFIPPVLSEDVFLKLYNNPNATNTDKLNLCGSSTNVFKYGNDENGTATLIPEGPYMQYTNGLDMTGTNAVPDTKTKFVLAYGLNIQDTTANGTVAKIRSTLEKLGYHQAEFDVQSLSGNGTDTLTLTVSDSDFIDCLKNGVEYYLTLSAESVRDAAYNYYQTGIAANEYKFWVGPVATPVIRVNRTATNKNDVRPAGKTSIKIDCETPGASIKWGNHGESTAGKTVINTTENKTTHTLAADYSVENVQKILVENLIATHAGSNEIADAVGDGNINKETNAYRPTAEKYFIRATAEKSGFGDPVSGYEGAFKTFLHYYVTKKTNFPNDRLSGCFLVYGAETPEGVSSTAGFPLTQNTNSRDSYQVAYAETVTGGKTVYWESWQILTPFTLQTVTNSFQDPADPACTYGQYIYGHIIKHYGDDN